MLDAPRVPSYLPRALIALGRAVTRLPVAWSVAALAIGLVAVALSDAAMGHRFSSFPFYLAAAGFAGWRLGERAGLLVAAAALLLVTSIAGIRADDNPLPWTSASQIATMLFLVALVVALRAAFDQQRWRATHDPLTGALNRAAFFERLQAAATRIGRDGTLLLACIDLDGFKPVNDEFGHAEGDRLLRDFAGGAAAVGRRGDLLGRIGGDEFAMLLAVPPGEDGGRHAARLHAELATVLAATGHAVTCSIGAILLSACRSHDAAALVARADAVMYEVKRRGKNGIRVAGPASLESLDPRAPVRDAA